MSIQNIENSAGNVRRMNLQKKDLEVDHMAVAEATDPQEDQDQMKRSPIVVAADPETDIGETVIEIDVHLATVEMTEIESVDLLETETMIDIIEAVITIDLAEETRDPGIGLQEETEVKKMKT